MAAERDRLHIHALGKRGLADRLLPEKLGARHIKVGDFFGTQCPMPRLIEEFGALCREAEARGTRVVYEMMPFSAIDSLEGSRQLVEGAAASIDMHTPYFLPDRAMRRALVRAAGRGVRVRIIVPGALTDQRLVRLASRRMYRELLAGGVRIHEYAPAMTHAKVLLVDEAWAVIGTTNMDNRSFEHNDEINVAFRERAIAARLRRDFESVRARATCHQPRGR